MPKDTIKFLASNTIGQRIMLGFALLLLVSILVAAFNISRLTDLKNRFTFYKQVSIDTHLMLKIDKDISEVQRYILIFSETGSLAAFSQLEALHLTLIADTKLLGTKQSFEDKASQALLNQLQSAVERLGEKIQSLQTQHGYRNDLIDNKLAMCYRDINYKTTGLITKAENIKNKAILTLLWYVDTHVSQAEVLGGRYFNNREFELKRRAIASIDDALSTIKSAQVKVINPTVATQMNEIVQLLAQTKLTFLQAVQADRDYLFLINIIIAGESAELSYLADRLKVVSLGKQNQLYSMVEQRITNNKRIALYATIFSTLLAVLIAVVMARYISKPLIKITETFSKLAKGEILSEIPGVTRNDEIGDLAQAANVFRETNLQTQQLLKQAEEDKYNLLRHERELERTNENLYNFTSIASHDLKSPLRGIFDLAEWIKDDLGEDISETAKHNLDRIQQRIKRLETLIEDLLEYSRAGKVSSQLVLVKPIELVHEVLDLQNIPSGFNVTVSGNAADFHTARTPLQTSLRNVISNAIRHHDKTEGKIEIRVKEDSDYCIFEVIDDGPGIPYAAQERIFMLFQTLSKNKKSSGLGLAFSKRMIEAHNGRIEVESSIEKRGATFRIWWPKFNSNIGQDISR